MTLPEATAKIKLAERVRTRTVTVDLPKLDEKLVNSYLRTRTARVDLPRLDEKLVKTYLNVEIPSPSRRPNFSKILKNIRSGTTFNDFFVKSSYRLFQL